MIKTCHFSSVNQLGFTAIPLFGPADSYFEKTASTTLLPSVVKFIEGLKPVDGSQYVLINALGASEYYGSNSNGDAFSETGLIHRPDNWRDDPALDAIRSKDWPYGFPTFYNAHAFGHHRNNDPTRAYGDVVLASYNNHMRRVELVGKVDKIRCEKFGGLSVWDRLKAGQYPETSMGAKVPFDTCSVCLDKKLYREALETFDPGKHKYPGQAILEFHKKLKEKNGTGIRGVSVTRKDYCGHAKDQMNQILPSGLKVWVDNDYPRFFDISFVFVGADKTSKVMLKIADEKKVYSLAAKTAATSSDAVTVCYRERFEKCAAAVEVEDQDLLKIAFLGKKAKAKSGEIIKDVIPDWQHGSAIKRLTSREETIPSDVLDDIAKSPLEEVLSTAGGLGIPFRPREFQRIVLVQIGKKNLADEFEDKGTIFPDVKDGVAPKLGPEFFSKALASILGSLFAKRSALGPALEDRLLFQGHEAGSKKDRKKVKTSSQDFDLLNKIGAAYKGYREATIDLLAYTQPFLSSAFDSLADLRKLAEVSPSVLLTPLVVSYLQTAFWDEVSVLDSRQ